MNFKPMIIPHDYDDEKSNIHGTHLEIIQQPDLLEQAEKDICKALEPFSKEYLKKGVEITVTSMEKSHEEEFDYLRLSVDVFLKPKK